ncbi:MAG: TRAP transporter substrate-binding protein [Natronospirillum sp.]|uniref:TRAP transporter substrate-binding protein n=1 Tax=Natronospirillum sp. TaxID=2812955 RepID=UPI0025E4677D|nr:TRAP transporter substrate-binding protein [Natronospirillum sp.]MCH8551748.1 TRAP transporter substrate-binding protein [Natronospirillum sp.]
MKRRDFLTGSAAAAGVGAMAIGSKSIAQGSGNRTWSMVTTWPRNFPGLGVGAQRLADRITQMSGGRLTVRVYSAGELVPALESLDAVIEGSAEMMHGAAYYWINRSEGLSFFTGVPYGMTSREMAAWVRYMGGQEIWDDIYDQFGVKGFLSGDTGTQAGGWFPEELKSLDDIQGLRFRTPGLGGEVWNRIGTTTVNMAGGEIFQALQSGALDAAEFVGPYNDLALGFHQIHKNYYFPSFIEPGLATECVVDKAKFEELPSDLQRIVELACQAEYDQVASDFYANDPIALQTLVNDHGVIVRQFPEDILEAGANAAKEIIMELRDSSDPLTRRTTESFIESLNLLRARTDDNDLTFLEARRRYFDLTDL